MVPRKRARLLLALLCAAVMLGSVATARADATPDSVFDPTAGPLPQVGLAAATVTPSGFQQSTALSGLDFPTAVRFSPDGRVFIAQKNGQIKVFDGLDDPTPTLYADLSTSVHDFWDRGLLGLALDPQFTTGRPYLYVALHPRRGHRRHRTQVERRLPDSARPDRRRLCRQRPALEAERRV